MTTIRANGKLLLSAEYAVLDGALAAALPTRLGQVFRFECQEHGHLCWNAHNTRGELWMQAKLNPSDLAILASNHEAGTLRLVELFRIVRELRPDVKFEGLTVRCDLEFPNDWGLGSSSTLVYALATFFNVDPYELLSRSFGGSGYDIACAAAHHPISYQINGARPIVESIQLPKVVRQNSYFIYSNQKQDSREGIERYRQNRGEENWLSEISDLSRQITKVKSVQQWQQWVEFHEYLISQQLGLLPLKETYFSDFNGSIKSLGAWGGDFFMAVSEQNPMDYFLAKGYKVFYAYGDLILG